MISLKAEYDLFLEDVLDGLSRERKELPCKYFYDRTGAKLFDEICGLLEYYPAWSELEIMKEKAGEMACLIGRRALVVEFGSGNCRKTRLLLDRLEEPGGFIPIDISKEYLEDSVRLLRGCFPSLEIQAVCGDFTRLPPIPVVEEDCRKTVVFFPGSTLGNLVPRDAARLLRRIALLCGCSGGLLIGIDLKKERAILERAYNDRLGITAAFNKNMLTRMNRELGTDFRVEAFSHEAVYNEAEGCVEMRLVSQRAQAVRIKDTSIPFRQGESILTERSYKYTLEEFRELSVFAGFQVKKVWMDSRRLFSVQYLAPQL